MVIPVLQLSLFPGPNFRLQKPSSIFSLHSFYFSLQPAIQIVLYGYAETSLFPVAQLRLSWRKYFLQYTLLLLYRLTVLTMIRGC